MYKLFLSHFSALSLLTAVFSLATPTQAQNEEEPYAADRSKTWIYTISFETIGIDKEAAAQEFIKDSAWSINIDAEYFFTSTLSSSIGIGFLSYSDRAGFSQTVQSTFEGISTESSSADALPIYAEFGYRNFFGHSNRAYWSARAGVSALAASQRGIDNCSDCREEDIDIDGGAYGLAGIGYRVGNTWSIGLQYKQYFSGDLENSVGLNFLLGL